MHDLYFFLVDFRMHTLQEATRMRTNKGGEPNIIFQDDVDKQNAIWYIFSANNWQIYIGRILSSQDDVDKQNVIWHILYDQQLTYICW